MKNHLEQKIAHLLGELLVIAGIESVDNFVRFFNQVRAQRRVGLLAVPRAALWRAKALLHGDKFFEPFSGRDSLGARRFACWSTAYRSFLSWFGQFFCWGAHRVSAECFIAG